MATRVARPPDGRQRIRLQIPTAHGPITFVAANRDSRVEPASELDRARGLECMLDGVIAIANGYASLLPPRYRRMTAGAVEDGAFRKERERQRIQTQRATLARFGAQHPEQDKIARLIRTRGLSDRAIASHLGIDRGTVARVRRRLGYTARQVRDIRDGI